MNIAISYIILNNLECQKVKTWGDWQLWIHIFLKSKLNSESRSMRRSMRKLDFFLEILEISLKYFETYLKYLEIHLTYSEIYFKNLEIYLKSQFMFQTSWAHLNYNFAKNSMVLVIFVKKVRFWNGGHFKIRPHYFFSVALFVLVEIGLEPPIFVL